MNDPWRMSAALLSAPGGVVPAGTAPYETLSTGRSCASRPVSSSVGGAARVRPPPSQAPARASKIARGLRTSIWSIWSSLTPAFRSAGRMSSEMWL